MATQSEHQLDNIYRAIGHRGRFTIVQMFILWLAAVPTGLQLLSNVFIGPQVDHQCARPNNETEEEFLKPFQAYDNVSVSYGQCDIQVFSGDKVVKTEKCVFGMAYDQPRDKSFIAEFDLVCDSTNLGRLSQTLVIGGQGFGAVLGSLLADKLGRKPVIVGANMGLLVTGIAIAFSPSFLMFALCKFIVGSFQNALVSVTATLRIELFVIKDRRLATCWDGVFWATGVIILDFIAFLMKDYTWRQLQLVLSLCSLPVIIHWLFLRESLRWMMANGKNKESIDYINSAAAMNGKTSEEIAAALDLQSKVPLIEDDEDSKDEKDKTIKVTDTSGIVLAQASRKLSYIDIFRIPRLLLNTVIMWTVWFNVALAFFAIYLTATTLAGDRYLNFFLTAIMEVPPNFVMYLCLNRYGRKFALISLFMTMSFGLLASGIFRTLEQTTVVSVCSIISYMVGMMGASGGFTLCFSYTPELFPTNIRNQALGISSFMGRIGGMLAPFTGLLSEKAKWGPGLLIGGMASIVAVLLRFVPETNGRELPQTLEEQQAWFKDNQTTKKKEKKKEANEVI